ncbi:DUF6036 family nucleotidyltransferase [Flavobacterium phragmitis]|uniref:DUF6036 domain-containing protein n=1 Tax=Flavobacterium phragmitis TaxID=739143 RepID=A0A1I1JSV8_9FLAO|nr:DUF6036 family nucleotidyltransferase [Flavobacterium phragmitis]SFC51606.1 hypothetical protein SAMN05216297_10194 [Flavobacterium phragmitis]
MLQPIILLNNYQIRYLVIGSFAMLLNGVSVIPSDLDLWIDYKDEKNRHLFNNFLKEIAKGETIKDEEFFIHYKYGLYLYNFLSVASGLEFEMAYNNSTKAVIENTNLRCLSLDDIVLNKLAVNRPKDALDIIKIKSFNHGRIIY